MARKTKRKKYAANSSIDDRDHSFIFLFEEFDFSFLLPYPSSAMPVLQASVKHARQSEVRRERRRPMNTAMKTAIRSIQDLAKEGKLPEAQKALSNAFKKIDLAAKKNLIHWKNAAHKKSALAKLVGKKA